jgi:hypothetical protein
MNTLVSETHPLTHDVAKTKKMQNKNVICFNLLNETTKQGNKRTKVDDAIHELANETGLTVADITKFVEESMAKKAKQLRIQEKKEKEAARKIELGIARVGDIFEQDYDFLYDANPGNYFQIIGFKGKLKGALTSEGSSGTVVLRKIRHEQAGGEFGPYKAIKDAFIGDEQIRRIEFGESPAYIPALFASKIIQ